MGHRIHDTSHSGLILRNAIWHARFTVKGETVARSTKTSNRREAERIVAKWRSELVQQVVLEGKRPIKTHDAIDLFVKSRSHLASAQNCEIHIRYFKALPNHNLDRLTDLEIDEVISKKRSEGYAESTLKVSVTYFNAMLSYCDSKGYTSRKKIKTIKHDSKRIRWMTVDEEDRLFAVLDPTDITDEVLKAQRQDNWDLCLMLSHTAARVSEVSDMSWGQVDFDTGNVLIKRRKGGNDTTLQMTKKMREVLERRRKLSSSEYVFETKVGKNNNGRWMQSAVKRAKLSAVDGAVTIHTFRHTRAVRLLQGGMNILDVKYILGHKSIQSTMCYMHLVESDTARKAAAIIDGV